MEHGLVAISDYDILNQRDLSFLDLLEGRDVKSYLQIWNELMKDRGFEAINEKPFLQPLFNLICDEFASTFGGRRNLLLREGYISRERGQKPVKHNEKARIFSQSQTIYIDLLMSSVLFDYVATFYIWARYFENAEVAGECFNQTLYLLEGCCRKGSLSDSEGAEALVKIIVERLSDREVELVGDLYWSVIAFAICHEIAHVYLEHGCAQDIDEAHKQEFEADAAGYDVFLRLMVRHMNSKEDVPSSIFRENLYAAPMILFLFYHDLYSMGYWLYGDVVSNTHPGLMERIDKLIDMSMKDIYEFDNSEGNIVLASFMDVSERFLEELWFKIRSGKLATIMRKGENSMENNGFENAIRIDEEICNSISEYASTLGYDSNRLIGLWNFAAKVSSDSFGDQKGIVYQLSGKTYSTKGLNLIYNQKLILEMIIESGLTITPTKGMVETIRLVLHILFKIALCSTMEIKTTHAELIKACYEEKAYIKPIEEETLLSLVQTANHDDITELDKSGCLTLTNGYVYLREKIVFSLTTIRWRNSSVD